MIEYTPPMEWDFTPEEWEMWLRGLAPRRYMTREELAKEYPPADEG